MYHRQNYIHESNILEKKLGATEMLYQKMRVCQYDNKTLRTRNT